jgi:hypothetical protein
MSSALPTEADVSDDNETRGRRISSPRTGRSFTLLVDALAALMLLIAGCGGGDDDADTKSEGTGTSTTADDGGGGTTDGDGTAPDSTEGSTEGEELEADLPRTIDYGFLSFEVTKAEQLDEHPYDPALGDPEKTYVGVEMTVTNPDENNDYPMYPQNFQIEAGDEKSDDAFNQENGLTASKADETEVEMWFPLDKGTDLSEPVLVISEPDYEPARLPLSGDEPTTSVEVPGDPATVTNGTYELTFDGGGTVDFNRSVVDGEVGPDVDPSPLGRAPEGTAYLHLPGTGVDSGDGQWALAEGYQFSPTFTVDGGPTTGKSTWYDYVDNETVEGELTIKVSQGSEEVVVKLDYTDAAGAMKSFTYTVDVSAMSDLAFASD